MFFLPERYNQSYNLEMQAFVRALTAGTEMPVNGADGLKSVLIALAAQKSLTENKPAKVE